MIVRTVTNGVKPGIQTGSSQHASHGGHRVPLGIAKDVAARGGDLVDSLHFPKNPLIKGKHSLPIQGPFTNNRLLIDGESKLDHCHRGHGTRIGTAPAPRPPSGIGAYQFANFFKECLPALGQSRVLISHCQNRFQQSLRNRKRYGLFHRTPRTTERYDTVKVWFAG
jgi:hypothetical protein